MFNVVWKCSLLTALLGCSLSVIAEDATSLRCGDAPYGVNKTAYRAYSAIPAMPVNPEQDLDAHPEVSGKTFQQAFPLEARPPEIARIRRGYVSGFVGGSINDGISSWQAIDLDRDVAYFVQRRTYDLAAKMSRPFKEPVLREGMIARKSISGTRVEEEVVWLIRLSDHRKELEDFICNANKLWEAGPQPNRPMPTDALQASTSILDIGHGGWVAYAKDVPFGYGLAGAVDGLYQRDPFYW